MHFRPYPNAVQNSQLEQFYLERTAQSNFTFNRVQSTVNSDREPTKMLIHMLTHHGLNLNSKLQIQYLAGNGKVNGVVRQILTENSRRYKENLDPMDSLDIVLLSNAVDQTTTYLESEDYKFDHTLARLSTYTRPVKALKKTFPNGNTSTYIILTDNEYPDIRRALTGYLVDRIKPQANSPAMEWIVAYDSGDDTAFTNLIIKHEEQVKAFELSKNDTINKIFLGPKRRIKNQLNDEIRHHKNRIKDLEEALELLSKNLFEAREKLSSFKMEGLTDEEKEQSKLLMDILTKSPIIKEYDIYTSGSDTQIRMQCIAPLKFYDREFLARHRAREGATEALDILDEITYHLPGSKIQLIAELRLDLSRFSVGADHPYISDTRNLYQPHLVYHNCFGDNARNIRDLLRDGKISEAVVATLACMSSINFLDSTVFHKFKRDLTCNRKYLLLKDGTYIGAKEILEIRKNRLAQLNEA